jgi:hypothetical protein
VELGLVDGVAAAGSFLAVSEAVLLASFFGDPSVDDSVDFRLSVMYQPDPLKTTPTFWITRWTAPPHDGQTESGSSLNF